MTTTNNQQGMPITKARSMLTQLSDQLVDMGGALPLTRHGEPVMALVSWELYEAIMETLEIMGDPEMMEQLRKGIEDVKAGRFRPWEEAKADLDLD